MNFLSDQSPIIIALHCFAFSLSHTVRHSSCCGLTDVTLACEDARVAADYLMNVEVAFVVTESCSNDTGTQQKPWRFARKFEAKILSTL